MHRATIMNAAALLLRRVLLARQDDPLFEIIQNLEAMAEAQYQAEAVGRTQPPDSKNIVGFTSDETERCPRCHGPGVILMDLRSKNNWARCVLCGSETQRFILLNDVIKRWNKGEVIG